MSQCGVVSLSQYILCPGWHSLRPVCSTVALYPSLNIQSATVWVCLPIRRSSLPQCWRPSYQPLSAKPFFRDYCQRISKTVHTGAGRIGTSCSWLWGLSWRLRTGPWSGGAGPRWRRWTGPVLDTGKGVCDAPN